MSGIDVVVVDQSTCDGIEAMDGGLADGTVLAASRLEFEAAVGDSKDDIDVGFVRFVEAVEQDDHRLVDRQPQIVDLSEAHALAKRERRRPDPHDASVRCARRDP